MKNKYDICWLQICPFDRLEGKVLRPDRNNYPYRLCVLDRDNLKAIDVKTEAEYEFIKTSMVYFLNEESKKIKECMRYAIMELHLSILGVDRNDIMHAKNIIQDLKKGKTYINGNEISNEEYLDMIKNENKKKIKIIRK